MNYSSERIIKNKVGLLNLAEELGNISKACKIMGFSRETFYRYHRARDEGGIEALLDKNRRKPNLKNRVDESIEEAVNDIDHTKTKTRSPKTNGICERFHRTILEEFYRVTFRKKIYESLEDLQSDLDDWIKYYNNERTHQGKMCCGRTPVQTFLDGKLIWQQKVDNLNLN